MGVKCRKSPRTSSSVFKRSSETAVFGKFLLFIPKTYRRQRFRLTWENLHRRAHGALLKRWSTNRLSVAIGTGLFTLRRVFRSFRLTGARLESWRKSKTRTSQVNLVSHSCRRRREGWNAVWRFKMWSSHT